MVLFNQQGGSPAQIHNNDLEQWNNEIIKRCKISKVITDSWHNIKKATVKNTEEVDIKDSYAVVEDSADRLLLNVFGVNYLIQLKFTAFNKAKIYYIKIDENYENVNTGNSNKSIEETINIDAICPGQEPTINCDKFIDIAIDDFKIVHTSLILDLNKQT